MLFCPGYYYFFERLRLCRWKGSIPGYLNENVVHTNYIQHFHDWYKSFYG